MISKSLDLSLSPLASDQTPGYPVRTFRQWRGRLRRLAAIAGVSIALATGGCASESTASDIGTADETVVAQRAAHLDASAAGVVQEEPGPDAGGVGTVADQVEPPHDASTVTAEQSRNGSVVASEAAEVRQPEVTRYGGRPPVSSIPRNEGFLWLSSRPWTKVYIDGGFVGNTPLLKHRLRPGFHRVVLKRRELGIRHVEPVRS